MGNRSKSSLNVGSVARTMEGGGGGGVSSHSSAVRSSLDLTRGTSAPTLNRGHTTQEMTGHGYHVRGGSSEMPPSGATKGPGRSKAHRRARSIDTFETSTASTRMNAQQNTQQPGSGLRRTLRAAHRRVDSIDAEVVAKSDDHQIPRRNLAGHTPGSTEMYGFVSWILSTLCVIAYFIWAFVPDSYLEACGIFYRPAKYWAIALPAWLCMTGLCYFFIAMALCFVNTQGLDSEHAITDKYARREIKPQEQAINPEMIPPIGDIDITTVNAVLYLDRHPSTRRA